jgi:hypothetical protein
MVMIPPDVGLRLRSQTDPLPLQPTAPIQQIPADLLELRQGQIFSARIQEALPDNTFRALVAGKSITLQLPEGAKTGDTLELVVIDRTPRVVIAQLAESTAAPTADPADYPYANLSSAGKMISTLLLPEGQQIQPALLNRGQPMLAHPPELDSTAAIPRAPAELAPALTRAVEQSGLFYEAHQAQWLAGKLPTAALLHEPQGLKSTPATLLENGIVPPRQDAPAGKPEPVTSAPSLLQTLFGNDEIGSRAQTTAETRTTAFSNAVPEDLRPLVQQQLEAAGSGRMAWHGEVWPHQTMEWEIEQQRSQPDGSSGGDENTVNWHTSLRLVTPRLGEVSASLHLTSAGVRLALTTPVGASAADLRDAAPALAAALDSAGVPLLAFNVKHHESDDVGGT